MSRGTVIALDAGQTGVKVQVRTRDGVRDETLPGVRTDRPVVPQIAALVRALTPQGEPLLALAAGVSGLTAHEADAAPLQRALGGHARVLLAHDSVTAYLGALGERRGAVVAAGTGVVTLAVGRTRVSRVDGWGNIMGDAGSAYWIGREGLDAAMRAFDGRSTPTLLTDLMRERWPDPSQAYTQLQADPDRVRVVAGFAEAVSDAAADDAVAARICLAAARELAHSVTAALANVADPGDDATRPVSAVGGVFRSDLILTRFTELMAEARPGIDLWAPAGDGLDGAVTLLGLRREHPLYGRVSVAAAVQEQIA
ncbi:BadF/BadG/BcrA/BcrD ATPase family protein [Microbacterium sp. KR10-403]|uniref:N-acetylglucosamine kinase n=1 Tax=Microbacterium sp. KR10-403 TaxID=3158581 RepID=UPI0032E4ADD5